MDLRQRAIFAAPVEGRSRRNGACGAGLQLEKGYPGAGSEKIDDADGLRGPLFFSFQKNKCPDKSGHLFLTGADCVFTQSVDGRFFCVWGLVELPFALRAVTTKLNFVNVFLGNDSFSIKIPTGLVFSHRRKINVFAP